MRNWKIQHLSFPSAEPGFIITWENIPSRNHSLSNMNCVSDITRMMFMHIMFRDIYHRMRKGKVSPHVNHLHYDFDKHNWRCSFMAFCWGISSCFCCECPFFCNQASVTDFSLRWRLAANVLKQFVLMLCWFKLYFHLPLKPIGCPSCARLRFSPHHGTAVRAFIFLFSICFTCCNIRALLHCRF